MGDPHNKARYGETWPPERILLGLEVLTVLRDQVVISGGWAWHFMSPEGHLELKHAHDHKDLDLFVLPVHVAEVVHCLKTMGFERVWTRYDRLESAEEFRRYERTVPIGTEGKTTRITIDFFVRQVPSIEVRGFHVVPPATLVTFYSNIHSSDKCFAVKNAVRLLSKGIDPVGHPDLMKSP